MRVAVFGGSGYIGSQVCKALIACGCAVTSASRGGAPPSRLEDEQWAAQVKWVAADAAVGGDAGAALAGGVDGVVSCIGQGDLQLASDKGWNSRWGWSEFSRRQYDENFLPNKQAVAAAQAADAQRFVYVGASSDCERGFGGPNPGLYMGKRDAALLAREAFGDGLTYVGPHLVVDSKGDARIKTANSGFGRGLMSINDFFGEIRSFGPDYTSKTRLTPPVPMADVALAITASVVGKVEVPESSRCCGMTMYSGVRESEQQEIADVMRHVDGTEAILELSTRAQREGLTL